MKFELISRPKTGGIIIPEKVGEIYCDPDTLIHEKVACFLESVDDRFEVIALEVKEPVFSTPLCECGRPLVNKDVCSDRNCQHTSW